MEQQLPQPPLPNLPKAFVALLLGIVVGYRGAKIFTHLFYLGIITGLLVFMWFRF